MPKSITNQNTADTYTDTGGANINSVYDSKGGWIAMAATVYAQVQHSSAPNQQQGQEQWSEEFILPAGAHFLQQGIIGIRCRSFTAGNPVAVSAAIFYKDEPAITLGGSGISTPASSVASLNFQHNDLAIATEPTADFEDQAAGSTNLTINWTVVDDPANTRVKITPVISWASPTVFPNAIGGGSASNAIGAAAGYILQPIGTLNLSRASGGVIAITEPGDTLGQRWLVSADGTMQWGPGNAAVDTTLQRVATIPPSPGQIGLQTQQAFNTTNTTGGYIYTAAANNSAFLCFTSTADTIPVFKIFTQGAMEWGPGGSGALDMELARVTNSPSGTGTFLELITLLSAFGYGTGLGGSVTLVAGGTATLNKASGKLTAPSAIASGGQATYTVSNTLVGAQDVIILNLTNGAGGVGAPYSVSVNQVNAGSFVFNIVNNSGVSITPTFNFAVFKASSS